jgi:hypothetical protein
MVMEKKKGRGRPKGSKNTTSKIIAALKEQEFGSAKEVFIPKFTNVDLENGTKIRFYFAGEIKEGTITSEEKLFDGTKVYMCQSTTLLYPTKKDKIIEIIE